MFAVNAKTMAWIDAKCSGITKNDPKSVLCGLKSPIIVLSGRYREISVFSFVANYHFYPPFTLPFLALARSIITCMHALHVITLKHCYIGLTSVAQLFVVNIADII